MIDEVQCEFVNGPVDGLTIHTPSIYVDIYICILRVLEIDSLHLRYDFKCSIQPFEGSTHYRFTTISDSGHHIYTPYE